MTKHDVTVLKRLDQQASLVSEAGRSSSTASFDEAKYLPFLDELVITEDHKREFLRILWDMMRMCIEIGAPAQSWGQICNGIVGGSADGSKDIESTSLKRR